MTNVRWFILGEIWPGIPFGFPCRLISCLKFPSDCLIELRATTDLRTRFCAWPELLFELLQPELSSLLNVSSVVWSVRESPFPGRILACFDNEWCDWFLLSNDSARFWWFCESLIAAFWSWGDELWLSSCGAAEFEWADDWFGAFRVSLLLAADSSAVLPILWSFWR